MTRITEVGDWIGRELARLTAKYDVPAAAVAVSVGDEVVDHATGLLSRSTGVAATTDSLFQIGSITKVWTATLVMQLVGEGRVDLDAPLRTYLPDFAVADSDAADVMTVRQLLCHTAGFEGDIFTDTGPGDDCIEKYVGALAEVPQLFAPGELFSYNNAGYCVLGRLVEVLRGQQFDACVREHLFTRLGLEHAANGPYEAILYRAAVGHVRPHPRDAQQVAPVWALPRSNSPAGSMLTMRARDLIAFAQMHLNGGVAAHGATVLPDDLVRAMQQRQVELPDLRVLGNAWGLGWEIYDVDGGVMIGHDGNTIGQAAFLRMVPARGVSVALLTNGGDAFELYRDVVGHVLAELADLELEPLPVPPKTPTPFDASRFLGTYAIEVADLQVSQDQDGRIWIDQTPKGIFAEMGEQPERREMVHFEGDTLIPLEADRGLHLPHAFVGDDGAGHPRYLHIGRAIPRARHSAASAPKENAR